MTDDGTDDDNVVLMLDGSIRMYADNKRIPSGALTMVDGSMRPIYDEDGDGVEDNVKKTRDELDRFYDPLVFGYAEEIHNTIHGNLPGHVRKSEYKAEYSDHRSDLIAPVGKL